MAFYFQPGDFQLGEQSLYPLQYSPELTGQDLYDHIQQQIGSACQIMIENQGQWTIIEPQWMIGQCFAEGNYQLSVFLNGVPQPEQPQQNQQNANTDGPKTISAHVYINQEHINEIAVPIEASLLQIVQQIELPPGQGLLSYALYDVGSNPLIQDQDHPMVDMLQQQQPLILNITTQPIQNQQVQQQGFGDMSQSVPNTQEVTLHVFLNGEPFQQISAPAISSIVQIIQQIEFPPDQTITNYGLYDQTGSPLSIDTDAQLNSFAQQLQPFSLNLTTASQQVKVYILLNGVLYNVTDYSPDTSLSQIVNQVQLSQGQIMQQYTLNDAQGAPLVENRDVVLKQFSNAQQPFTLNIITTMGNQIKYSAGQQFPLNAQQNVAPQVTSPFAPPGFQQQVPPPQQPFPVQLAPQIQQQPQPQIPEPPKLTAKERAKQAMQELKILKKFSLLIDLEGEFVVFKYHLPVMVQGVLRKETSSEKKSFKKDKHTWDTVNKVKYAETGDYAFAIEWDNGYISKFKLNLL